MFFTDSLFDFCITALGLKIFRNRVIRIGCPHLHRDPKGFTGAVTIVRVRVGQINGPQRTMGNKIMRGEIETFPRPLHHPGECSINSSVSHPHPTFRGAAGSIPELRQILTAHPRATRASTQRGQIEGATSVAGFGKAFCS